MTTPDPITPAPTDTPATPAPQTPTPTPPAPTPVRASGSDSSMDLMDAINALPEKLAATFQEMAATKVAPVEPPKDTDTDSGDTETTKTVKRTAPAKTKTPTEQTPPRKPSFADKWFGRTS